MKYEELKERIERCKKRTEECSREIAKLKEEQRDLKYSIEQAWPCEYILSNNILSKLKWELFDGANGDWYGLHAYNAKTTPEFEEIFEQLFDLRGWWNGGRFAIVFFELYKKKCMLRVENKYSNQIILTFSSTQIKNRLVKEFGLELPLSPPKNKIVSTQTQNKITQSDKKIVTPKFILDKIEEI